MNIHDLKALFIFLSTICLFVGSTFSQTEANENLAKNIIVLGEKHIDSLFYFKNPLVKDPLLTEKHLRHNLWKKSFKSSSLHGFLNANFNTIFFDAKYFDDYDFFLLLPDSYVICDDLNMIKEILPLLDTDMQKRILSLPVIMLYSFDIYNSKREKEYAGYPYFIYHYTTSSFLEISVNASYYTKLFLRHALTDPPTCWFCDKPFQDMIYFKVLIPMSDEKQE